MEQERGERRREAAEIIRKNLMVYLEHHQNCEMLNELGGECTCGLYKGIAATIDDIVVAGGA